MMLLTFHDKLNAYVALGVNRISLGVQSFKDDLLKICHRTHTASQAISVIENIKKKFDIDFFH